MRQARRPPADGFTLTEVAVALVLFGVLGLAAVQIFLEAARESSRTRGLAALLWEGESVADSLAAELVATSSPGASGRAAPGGGGERRVEGAGQVRWAGGAGGVSLEPGSWSESWIQFTVPRPAPDAGISAW